MNEADLDPEALVLSTRALSKFLVEGDGDTSVTLGTIVAIALRAYIRAVGDLDRSALSEVRAERIRQVTQKGYTAEHDDAESPNGEIAAAAGCYALYAYGYMSLHEVQTYFPWNQNHWTPDNDARATCIKAAALLVAEVERIDRETERERLTTALDAAVRASDNEAITRITDEMARLA